MDPETNSKLKARAEDETSSITLKGDTEAAPRGMFL